MSMTDTGKTVYIYTITRTRLVTERFRVTVDRREDEDAINTLADEMELPQQTEHCELLEVSTVNSELEFDAIDQESY